MHQFDGIFKAPHKTVAALLAEAGFDPVQIRQGRAFASQWAWSDGSLTVASVWENEIDEHGDQLSVRFSDPRRREDLHGQRRSRALYFYDVLSAMAGHDVRAIVQRKNEGKPGQASSTERRALDVAAWEVRAEPGKIVLVRLERIEDSPEPAHAEDWTDEELNASVIAYLDMQSKISSGTPVVKKHYYVELAGRFGRTWKAFEYRMQNISYVIALRGRAWIPGLVPAKHVGSKTAAKIEEFLGAHETTLEGNEAAFEVQVAEAFRRLRSKPAGRLSPTAVATVSLQFVRDPEVKAWVLRNAEGVCECCQQQAPFESISGPFLEVHHVQRLADKGADTVENAIAICPNCHRRLHYALNAAELIDQIYARIGRLIRKHDATTTSTPSSDLELGHL